MAMISPLRFGSPARHIHVTFHPRPAGSPALAASPLEVPSTSPRGYDPCAAARVESTSVQRPGTRHAAAASADAGARGMSRAATHPTIAKTPSTRMASAKGRPKDPEALATSDPAMATPSDDPRFETLRDTPEMSPCTFSGQADCTRFTDAVSMMPT